MKSVVKKRHGNLPSGLSGKAVWQKKASNPPKPSWKKARERDTANEKSALVKLTGLKWSILPSLMRIMMKRWKMKPLPANPGLEASLKIDVEALCKISKLATAQLQSFQDFALDFLQVTRAGWTGIDRGGQGDCGYRSSFLGRRHGGPRPYISPMMSGAEVSSLLVGMDRTTPSIPWFRLNWNDTYVLVHSLCSYSPRSGESKRSLCVDAAGGPDGFYAFRVDLQFVSSRHSAAYRAQAQWMEKQPSRLCLQSWTIKSALNFQLP